MLFRCLTFFIARLTKEKLNVVGNFWIYALIENSKTARFARYRYTFRLFKIKIVSSFSWDMITLRNNKISQLKLYKTEIEEEKTYLMTWPQAFSQNCLYRTSM